ncbi:hypothetical protein B296_00009518 [Ensete ventricosum]|uniref:Transport inhibitor response 1 domain-containing protein n=1 Tax=Ensete ventricosum TaxID=4639 RepID=A0A427BAC6_ENSVE|nr:hypothetical protein B296_00009518 [Ensete ventricosum]
MRPPVAIVGRCRRCLRLSLALPRVRAAIRGWITSFCLVVCFSLPSSVVVEIGEVCIGIWCWSLPSPSEILAFWQRIWSDGTAEQGGKLRDIGHGVGAGDGVHRGPPKTGRPSRWCAEGGTTSSHSRGSTSLHRHLLLHQPRPAPPQVSQPGFLKFKGKPGASIFNFIQEDWGGYAGPWVRGIAEALSCLETIYFRCMIVKDDDIGVLVRARADKLKSLKFDKYSEFSTDSL